jgi:hypothetical protein
MLKVIELLVIKSFQNVPIHSPAKDADRPRFGEATSYRKAGRARRFRFFFTYNCK